MSLACLSILKVFCSQCVSKGRCSNSITQSSMGKGPPSTISSAGDQMNGKQGSLSEADRRTKTTKQKSVKDVLALLRSLFRGSALAQLAPLAGLAVAKTALKHVSARTQVFATKHPHC